MIIRQYIMPLGHKNVYNVGQFWSFGAILAQGKRRRKLKMNEKVPGSIPGQGKEVFIVQREKEKQKERDRKREWERKKERKKERKNERKKERKNE